MESRPKLLRSMEQAKSIAISAIPKPQLVDAAAANPHFSRDSATPARLLTIGITCAADNCHLANPGRGNQIEVR